MQSHRRRSRASAVGGFTLLELLTVLGILAVLMGMGIGVMSRVNFAKYGALGTVARVLRSARESAIASGLPVTVVCDGETSRLFDLSVRPIGLWHFEDADSVLTKGAFGLDARLNGARVAMPGRYGAALACESPGDFAQASIGDLPVWSLSTGLSVEADVLSKQPQAATIAQRGKQFRLLITADGSVEARVGLATDAGERAKDAGDVIATTPPAQIVPGRWTHIGFVYDRLALTVLVDGLPRASKIATDFVRRESAPLTISSKADGFVGMIDELKIGAVVPGEGDPLPKDVTFAKSTGRLAVRFTGEGMLDPAFHRASVAVGVRFGEGDVREVVVGPYGTVR